MIRHSPSERYIRYLLLDKPAAEDKEIRDILLAFELDPLTLTYISQVRRNVEVGKPEVFRPRDLTHVPSMQFIASKQVFDLFLPDTDSIIAFEILDMPRAKEFTEAALELHAAPIAIASKLRRLYGTERATPGAVQKYHQFFWDMNFVDTSDLRGVVLNRFVRDKETRSGDAKLLGECIAKTRYNDPRWVAANVSHSPVSALIAQISMGMGVPEFNTHDVMAESDRLLVLRSREELEAHGPDYDRRVLNLLQAMKITHELLQSKTNPQDELRAQLEAIQLRTDPRPTPNVLALTGGNHTVDLAKLPSAKESEK